MPAKAWKMSKKTKALLRAANKGKHFSPRTEFKKGNVPWNKGTAGMRLTTANSGSFKKGNRPQNWRPVGTITIRTTFKDGKSRRWIKVAEPKFWMIYAVFVMLEKRKGRKIPKGMVVLHKDYDTLNDDPGNLTVLPRNLHMQYLKIDNVINEEKRKRITSIIQKKRWARYREMPC